MAASPFAPARLGLAVLRADRLALLVDLAVGAGATRVLEAGVDE